MAEVSREFCRKVEEALRDEEAAVPMYQALETQAARELQDFNERRFTGDLLGMIRSDEEKHRKALASIYGTFCGERPDRRVNRRA